MAEYRLAEAEFIFADLIWKNEPIRSKDLVQLAWERLNWKSTTSYTVLKRLCDRGIFQNKNAIVTSLVSREEFDRQKSRKFVEDSFGGSLPRFLSAFIGNGRISFKEAEEIKRMIDEYREDGDYE